MKSIHRRFKVTRTTADKVEALLKPNETFDSGINRLLSRLEMLELLLDDEVRRIQSDACYPTA